MSLVLWLLCNSLHGLNGDEAGQPKDMRHHVLQNHTHLNQSSVLNNTLNSTAPPALAAPQAVAPNGPDGADKTIVLFGFLVSFCIFAVLGVVMTVVCWVRVFSQPKKPKDTDYKTKDTESLDKRNLRDVQLTEYEKRKRQMKEMDSQQEPAVDNGELESDDGDELDEITAIQTQPLEEETIVNPNFVHHYIPRQKSR